MFHWYSDYYAAVEVSRANAAYCERVFGRNLCQHGFADMDQLDRLLEVTGIRAGHRVLDLGCGNGLIAEYISDVTGAQVTGVDFIPGAIRQAQDRTLDILSARQNFELLRHQRCQAVRIPLQMV